SDPSPPTTSGPGSATTSATTPTWPSSGATTRTGSSGTTFRRSSTRWSRRWPSSSADRAVRVTLVNQFYAPDISPTAQLAASLAEHRADRGDKVTVITGRAGYLEGLARTEPAEHHEVTVQRVWTPDLGKATLVRRLTGYATFLTGSVVQLLRLPA